MGTPQSYVLMSFLDFDIYNVFSKIYPIIIMKILSLTQLGYLALKYIFCDIDTVF